VSRFSNLEFNRQWESSGRLCHSESEVLRCMAEAQEAFERANFEQALRLYSRAIELKPAHAAAWSGVVRALIEEGNFDEANRWSSQAIERFPREPELLSARAVVLGRIGDLEGAISFSDASIEEHGHTAYVWLARGDVLLARREQRANYCFDQAFGLAPHNWFVAWLAARVRLFYHQFSLALKLVQHALELKPDHAVLWVCAGTCQRELGLIRTARLSFQHATELDPDRADARRGLGELGCSGPAAVLRGWWRRRFKR
jgi:tetratricopeptide (TPR) repeat protein